MRSAATLAVAIIPLSSLPKNASPHKWPQVRPLRLPVALSCRSLNDLLDELERRLLSAAS
ncbi:MAG UNVERIFIED_CONTAM: hypothetical protein LVR18_38945 [Planctomycetaceae bacterium]